MKIEMKVTEDTLSSYMDALCVNMEKEKQPFLKEMADIFAEMAIDEVGLYGYTLRPSLENNHIFQEYGGLSEVDIIYTGTLSKISWWEFRDDHNKDKPPERDYAYFQETGKDKIAKEKDARHTGAIKYTAAELADIIHIDVEELLDRVLKQTK